MIYVLHLSFDTFGRQLSFFFFFAQPPIFRSFAPLKNFLPPKIPPPPLKILLPPTFFSTPSPIILLRSLSNSHFLSPSKKWGCKPKKVGVLKPKIPPASAPLWVWVMHGLGYG